MPRIFPYPLLAALLLAPVAAPAQTPGFTPEQTHALRWFTVALQHTKATDIVQEMNWSSQPTNSLFTLPPGTKYVFAEPANTLLVLATPDGFEETKNVVKVLDKTGYTFAPTLTFLSASSGDTRLSWTDGTREPLEVVLLPNPSGTSVFRAVKKDGAAVKTARLAPFVLYGPMQLIVVDARLRGNGTLTLDFMGDRYANGPAVEVSDIRPGDILAAKSEDKSLSMLIQVNY